MVKKAIALAGAGAILLSMAGPVFAHHWWGGSDNTAYVTNSAVAVADTGGNSQSNVADVQHGGGVDVYGASGSRTMTTGIANAHAGALVVANTHVGCGLCSSSHDDDYYSGTNGAVAYAYTGDNGQDDLAIVRHGGGVNVYGGAGTRSMTTKDANSDSHAWTIVNTHWH